MGMSKRSREDQNVCSPPKRIKLNDGQSDDEIYVPSPSPPKIVSSKVSAIMTKMSLRPPSSRKSQRSKPIIHQTSNNDNKVFDDCSFLIASIGKRDKRTNRSKKWSDLNNKRVD